MKKKPTVCRCALVVMLISSCLAKSARETQGSVTVDIASLKLQDSMVSNPLSSDVSGRLEEELDSIRAKTATKGISASVGIPGKGIWSACRGVTGGSPEETLSPDQPLCAGSITKVFTAVVILRLSEDNRLDLDSRIAEWFPDVGWARKVTVDHLLTHTSGIPGFDSKKEYEANKHLHRNPAKFLSYIGKKSLLFKPGKHYAYSNAGYILLGMIIERTTGKSYEEAVAHYITDRINLNATVVITAETRGELVVKGHHRGDVMTDTENHVIPFAAGSIAATPRDLVVFLQSLMSGKLLSDASLRRMFTGMNIMTTSQSTYYGRGIVAARGTPVGDIIGHTGGLPGFGASLFYHPKRNIFVCVMMNDDVKPVDPAMFRLMEAVTGP